jgi:threonine dehydratase
LSAVAWRAKAEDAKPLILLTAEDAETLIKKTADLSAEARRTKAEARRAKAEARRMTQNFIY